ncbi:low temperature requirement protein A [Micromonospora echinospora]|uniref:low temperature requirement protein A n=1 Tax=Micromonospora echinospora TaxID=1877 RepID=UPI0033E24892
MTRRLRPVTEHTQVTTAELFFDVVFVFAFIQVNALMVKETEPLRIAHGLLVFTMLWWSWSLFAWLGNRVRANYGLSRLTVLVVTPVMFVLAVTIPEAFQDLTGGVNTALWFVACFVLVRVLYLALRLYASSGLTGRDLTALVVPMAVASVLLLVAALLPRSALDPGRVQLGQVTLWAVAVAVDYGFGMALPVPARVISSVRHWTERHNLIVIIALGEVLVSIGIAGTNLPGSPGLFAASALAVVIAGALEWIYFDLSALAGEHALRAAGPAQRVALARDGYSYLHLPMMAGVILLALGLKHVPALVGNTDAYRRGDPLDDVGRWAMYGGAALFLVAHAAFQWRLSPTVARSVVWPRLTGAAIVLALLPVTAEISALRSLAWLAVVCLFTSVTEVVVSRGHRRRLRRALADEAEATTPGTGEPGPGLSPF